MSLHTSLKTLEKLGNKRDKSQFAFIKQILLMSSTLFGIPVGLHKIPAVDNHTKLAFSASAISMAFGIVLLSIGMYCEVAISKGKINKWRAEVQKQIKNADYKPMAFGKPSIIYLICEKAGFIFLILSVIFLAIYSVLIS